MFLGHALLLPAAAGAQVARECAPPGRVSAVRESLGACVNTPLDEAVPQISADGRTLYFTRRYAPENTGGAGDPDEIWVSQRSDAGAWGVARREPSPLNHAGPSWVISAPLGNRSLLLANAVDPGGRLVRGVSLARRRDDGSWSEPEMVRIPGFSTQSDWGHIHLGADGRVMVFSLIRPDTRGSHDLYVSFRAETGEWSEPRSLGGVVNTPGEEITPYIAADGETLYFSSDRPGGQGGQDVWVSRRLDETWTNWSEPQNLGTPVNGPADDAGYVVPASGDFAYFHSIAGVGRTDTDLFRVAVPPPVRPLPMTLVNGSVRAAATGQMLAPSLRYDALRGAGRGSDVPAGAAPGEFQLLLKSGVLWCVSAAVPGHRSIATPVDLTAVRGYQERSLDLRTTPGDSAEVIGGCEVYLDRILFDVARDDLTSAGEAQLDSLVALMARVPRLVVEVEGHTDSQGRRADNQSLAVRRARAVAAYLGARGIAAERVVPRGYGEDRPAAPNTTAAGRARNRRVEIRALRT